MGSRLVDLCINEARQRGFQTMYLETVEHMVAANHLYRKKGFKPLEGAMGATGHSGCDAFYTLPL